MTQRPWHSPGGWSRKWGAAVGQAQALAGPGAARAGGDRGGGDQGADPNKVVAITDRLGAQTLPAGESFRTLEAARSGQVLRGVSFTPGTGGH